MRPKPNIIVVGIWSELRFVLRVAAHANVWAAETIRQFVKALMR